MTGLLLRLPTLAPVRGHRCNRRSAEEEAPRQSGLAHTRGINTDPVNSANIRMQSMQGQMTMFGTSVTRSTVRIQPAPRLVNTFTHTMPSGSQSVFSEPRTNRTFSHAPKVPSALLELHAWS